MATPQPGLFGGEASESHEPQAARQERSPVSAPVTALMRPAGT